MFTTAGAAAATAFEYDTVIASLSRSSVFGIAGARSGALCVTTGAGCAVARHYGLT